LASLVRQRGQGLLLFDGDVVVGLTGVVTMSPDRDRVDGHGPTAVCVASYLRPAYRGRKLSRRFYEARIAWARIHGYRRIVTAHRLSNVASMRANQHFGFTEIQRVPHRWSDGVDEPEVVYELPLGSLRKIACLRGVNSGVE
jgi:GNAT superfamily N-acetyltransferase